jgi:hypothetical protein
MSDPVSSTGGGARLFTGHWGELAIAVILSAIAASDIAQASRDIAGDRATFGSFVLAIGAGDGATAAILFTEFRDEVQPLIDSWLAKDPFANLSVGSPFDVDSHTVFETVAIASAALDDAEAYTTVALEARSNAGSYTLATVMFAVVLFLAGLSRQFAIRAVTIGLASVASVLLAAGITALIQLPTLI